MNILMLYGREISQYDSGASRVLVRRANYLACCPNVKIYTTYRHTSEIDSRVTEIPVYLDSDKVHNIIITNQIDILAIPGGEAHSKFGHEVVQGTNCKIVTELHNKPGYEILNLAASIKQWGKLSTKNKTISYLKLGFIPLYKAYVKNKARHNFQNASLLADRLVVLVDSYIEEYKRAYQLPNAENIVAIGNPLSFETFADKQIIKQKEKTILVVSRLDETQKRISIAIKAWAKLEKQYPDWKMEIVGSGESEESYLNLITKLQLKHVTLCGRQNPEIYYEKAAIFLMTSAYEGWGMTLTESLQKGCVPVAINSFSALGCIITDGFDGFITPNNNLNAFVDKTKWLIEHPEIREKMAVDGVENCKRFAMEIIGKKWLELYQEVMKK